MNYIALNIDSVEEELSEILTAELADYPFESFETGEGTLSAYIPQEKFAGCKAGVDALLARYGVAGRYDVIETQNWNELWESDFPPVDLQGRLLIRAPFHRPAAQGVMDVVVKPDMSFGTGHHATTYLMAEQMLAMDFSGASVLDMGSGTGILAILAAQRGAVVVDAVDIDEWAYENCLENIQANGVQTVVCPILGDVSAIGGKVYDYILANINRNILLADMAQYAASLRKGGLLLVSGILDLDADTIVGHAARLGLAQTATNTRDGWAQVTFQKS